MDCDRHRSLRLAVALVGWLVCGCGDDGAGMQGTTGGSSDPASESTGSAPTNAAPTFEATVDAAAACTGGASALELRATRFACADPPPAPCTLPNPLNTEVGDRVSCPSSDSVAPLRLEVSAAGSYYVEVVTIAADGTEVGECHSDTAEPSVFVEKAALDTNPTIVVEGLSSPCPQP